MDLFSAPGWSMFRIFSILSRLLGFRFLTFLIIDISFLLSYYNMYLSIVYMVYKTINLPVQLVFTTLVGPLQQQMLDFLRHYNIFSSSRLLFILIQKKTDRNLNLKSFKNILLNLLLSMLLVFCVFLLVLV